MEASSPRKPRRKLATEATNNTQWDLQALNSPKLQRIPSDNSKLGLNKSPFTSNRRAKGRLNPISIGDTGDAARGILRADIMDVEGETPQLGVGAVGVSELRRVPLL